jgi:hypothetical protein
MEFLHFCGHKDFRSRMLRNYLVDRETAGTVLMRVLRGWHSLLRFMALAIRFDPGFRRYRRSPCELFAQQKTVRTAASFVYPDEAALRVDPPRLRKFGPGWIDGAKDSIAQQKTMRGKTAVGVAPHDIALRVDPVRLR